MLALCLPFAHGQMMQSISNAAAPAGGVWTLTQEVVDRSAWAVSLSCTGAVCTLTTASTGTGHGGLLNFWESSGGLTISSVTGGCTWTVQASAHQSTGPVGDTYGATCTSTTSGATSIVITFSGAVGDVMARFGEFAWSGSSISVDLVNSHAPGTTSTAPVETDMTAITGTSDVIGQMLCSDSSVPTAVTSPYNTNFKNIGTGSGASLGACATSYVMNTASGTAPTWTQPSGTFIGSAIALKGN